MAIVEVETRDDVALVTLNRPEKLNAINDEMLTGLLDAVEAIGHSDAIGAAVLTGRGRAFSTGGDITAMAAMDERAFAHTISLYMRVSATFRACPKPIIAAVHGYALAGGFELALACDVRFAAPARSSACPIRPGPEPDKRHDLSAAAGHRPRPSDVPHAHGREHRRGRSRADRPRQSGGRTGCAVGRGRGVRASRRSYPRVGVAWTSRRSTAHRKVTSPVRRAPRRRPSSTASGHPTHASDCATSQIDRGADEALQSCGRTGEPILPVG